MKRKLLRGFLILFSLAAVLFTAEAVRIATFHTEAPAGSYDCVIVLGAGVIGNRPSPVFEARLEHGVALFQQGRVKELILTGGKSVPGESAESEVGKAYAISKGVPASAIQIEALSHTTRENFIEAKKLMARNRFRKVLVVSDALHLRRALLMADDLGIEAIPSGTPTSRYSTWARKLPFLLRETLCSFVYRVLGK